eukprot:COSAG06_NODE_7077_length_2643_cov_9.201258_2_plen_70_part_00
MRYNAIMCVRDSPPACTHVTSFVMHPLAFDLSGVRQVTPTATRSMCTLCKLCGLVVTWSEDGALSSADR